jgi:proteic killer suppression protein
VKRAETSEDSQLEFEFKSRKLEGLYYNEKNAHKYPLGIPEAFYEVVGIIAAAQDERDLYEIKSLHYEKLKGSRKHQKSIKLNDQYRLIVELRLDDKGRYISIIDIDDYH